MGGTNVEIKNYLDLDDELYYPDNGCEVATAWPQLPSVQVQARRPQVVYGHPQVRPVSPIVRGDAEGPPLGHSGSVSFRDETSDPLTRIKARVKDALGEDLDLTDQDLQILSALPPMHRPKRQATIAPQATSTRRRGFSMTTRTITHGRPKQSTSTSWPTT